MNIFELRMNSPLGIVRLTATDDALVGIYLPDQKHGPIVDARAASGPAAPGRSAAVLERAEAQLVEYFQGRRTEFDLPLLFQGTEFQRCVWNALRTIPFGSTTSYGALARKIGRPSSARAVGAANGRNPFAIVVPCHRVVGSDGSLTGYDGGLDKKRMLLGHEQTVLESARPCSGVLEAARVT